MNLVVFVFSFSLFFLLPEMLCCTLIVNIENYGLKQSFLYIRVCVFENTKKKLQPSSIWRKSSSSNENCCLNMESEYFMKYGNTHNFAAYSLSLLFNLMCILVFSFSFSNAQQQRKTHSVVCIAEPLSLLWIKIILLQSILETAGTENARREKRPKKNSMKWFLKFFCCCLF